MVEPLPIDRLEAYSERFPQEVLLVQAHVDHEPDTVIIFRGFSSSLMRPTAFDPEVPVLPKTAVIKTLDRLQGPYQPEAPQYLERNISWATFRDRLMELGL